MRRLAIELGCGLMPLYSQVPSNAALLDAVAVEIMSRLELTATPQAGWEEQLRARAGAIRRIARTYPGCTVVGLTRPAVPAGVLWPAVTMLRQAGFDGPDAVRIMQAFSAFLAGSLLRGDLSRPDPEADFDFGLDLLVHAIRALQPARAGFS